MKAALFRPSVVVFAALTLISRALAGPAGQQPDQLYDWGCAISLMNQALERLGAENRAPDRQRIFVALRPYLECDDDLPDYAETAAEALEELCRLYWKPIYGFIRTRSHVPEDALDLTQGFFAHLLEKDLIHRADSQLGRFRSYLLGCLKNYLSDEMARATAKKRGGGWTQIASSVEEVEEWARLTASASERPDTAYDCACAVSLLQESLSLLEAECAARGRSRLFTALQPRAQWVSEERFPAGYSSPGGLAGIESHRQGSRDGGAALPDPTGQPATRSARREPRPRGGTDPVRLLRPRDHR